MFSFSQTTKKLLEISELYGRDFLERSKSQVSEIIKKQISYLENTDYDKDFQDPRELIHLDTNKLALHPDRLQAFLNGERIAPITIDMALTQKCSYACTFCYAGLQQNPSAPSDWPVYKRFLEDCTRIGHKKNEGVKAISLVSDGESTESPYYQEFVQYAHELGIDIASGTNGLKLEKFDLEILVKSLTYLRLNFNAAHPEAYQQVMGCSDKGFRKVVEITENLLSIKAKTKSKVTIGYQMVLMPEYADQVLPLASMSRDLGLDYLVIKHCSDDEEGRLGVDYSWYTSEEANSLLTSAERFSTPSYSSQAKWSKIRTGRDRIYSRCYGTPLLLQMSGTGIVAPCGSFFHKIYTDKHIGDIKEESFYDIWNSDKYQEVMNFLRSKKFDAKSMCATLCLQDKVNEELYKIIELDQPLPQAQRTDNIPHVNFI